MKKAKKYYLTAIAAAGILFSGGPLQAEMTESFCFVQSPFYQKLLDAGVFDIPVAPPLDGKPEPLQILFLKARMIHYSWDRQDTERWQSAEETAKVFRGSCADKAIWLYTHLRRNGYQNVSLVIGRYSPSSTVLHMWVGYQDPDGESYLLDPTIQRKPWKTEAFSEKLYKRLVIIDGSDCLTL
jgi:hypothetical protein